MADDQERDATTEEPGEPDASGHVEYGGHPQHGGGMVEPEEFPEGGTDVLEEEPPEGVTRDPRLHPPT